MNAKEQPCSQYPPAGTSDDEESDDAIITGQSSNHKLM